MRDTFDPIKDPDADLDYTWDWSAWLDTDETISDVTWIVPDGITQGTGDQAPSNNTTTATIWLSGGTAGEGYDITCRITTNQGRIDDRTRTIFCRQR